MSFASGAPLGLSCEQALRLGGQQMVAVLDAHPQQPALHGAVALMSARQAAEQESWMQAAWQALLTSAYLNQLPCRGECAACRPVVLNMQRAAGLAGR